MNLPGHTAAMLMLTLTFTGCTTVGIGVGATIGAALGAVVGTGGAASIVGGALAGGLIGSDIVDASDDSAEIQNESLQPEVL